MATPIRKKRNFKALQLDVTASTNPKDSEPVSTRAAPGTTGAKGKKRPPPMTLNSSKLGQIPPPNDADGGLFPVANGLSSAHGVGSESSRRNTYHTTLSNTLANLDMNAETRYDLRHEDLKDLQELGQGNGGSVKKVEHIPTKTIMAKKAAPHHTSWYVSCPRLLFCALTGIYVDIKPSNILFNSQGQIKICDFGVSGELINSIADTFVGTSTYMSVGPASLLLDIHLIKHTQPERIQGAQYTVKSDVWSLGISLIELALGRFPFSETDPDDSDLSDLEGTLSPSTISMTSKKEKEKNLKKDRRKSKGVSLQGGGMMMSILELLQHIVNEPAPRLTPEGRFPKEAEDFVDSCLLKDPDARKTPKDLLKHPWIEQAKVSTFDLEAWASTF
ncbi:hypothetical protein ID866_8192 [Astraeus odoratus]|nr:hypothetical protein ID866_8192 [Astraeus odoratus]